MKLFIARIIMLSFTIGVGASLVNKYYMITAICSILGSIAGVFTEHFVIEEYKKENNL